MIEESENTVAYYNTAKIKSFTKTGEKKFLNIDARTK
jgi:hypothetical protein